MFVRSSERLRRTVRDCGLGRVERHMHHERVRTCMQCSSAPPAHSRQRIALRWACNVLRMAPRAGKLEGGAGCHTVGMSGAHLTHSLQRTPLRTCLEERRWMQPAWWASANGGWGAYEDAMRLAQAVTITPRRKKVIYLGTVCYRVQLYRLRC